jgi:hypothetical protein
VKKLSVGAVVGLFEPLPSTLNRVASVAATVSRAEKKRDLPVADRDAVGAQNVAKLVLAKPTVVIRSLLLEKSTVVPQVLSKNSGYREQTAGQEDYPKRAEGHCGSFCCALRKTHKTKVLFSSVLHLNVLPIESIYESLLL